MNLAVAWWALGFGLLLWPVHTPAARRVSVLARRGRLRGPPVVPPGSTRHRAFASPALVAVLIGCLAVLTLGPGLGVAAAAGLGTVALPWRAAQRAGRRARFRRDLGTAVTVLRSELDAGTGLPAAVAAARARAGTAASVVDLRPRPTAPDAGPEARVFAAGAAVVQATGAPWSAVVAGLGRDLAARDAQESEVQTVLAGARASMLVLAALPVLGLAMGAAMGAHPLAFLLHSAAGHAVLALGTLLQLAGVAWTLRLAERAGR